MSGNATLAWYVTAPGAGGAPRMVGEPRWSREAAEALASVTPDATVHGLASDQPTSPAPFTPLGEAHASLSALSEVAATLRRFVASGSRDLVEFRSEIADAAGNIDYLVPRLRAALAPTPPLSEGGGQT